MPLSSWIYWAFTIPVTILVFVMWRVWYVFDVWRQENGTRASVHKDVRAWVNCQRLGIDSEADLESGKMPQVRTPSGALGDLYPQK